MEIAMMLVSLPLMLFGGFVLDAFTQRDDEDEAAEDEQLPESGLPPIL